MPHTVSLPRLSDTGSDVLVTACLASVGDTVERGQPVITVETDKVDADVPSPVAGRLTSLLVAEGDSLSPGTLIATIDTNV